MFSSNRNSIVSRLALLVSLVRNSIMAKMTLLVTLASSLVFAIIVVYSYNYSHDIIRREAEQNARNLTLSETRKIEQVFRSLSKVPKGLAEYLRIHPCDFQSIQR